MKAVAVVAIVALISSCSPASDKSAYDDPNLDPARQLGLLWVKHAAEYEAITRQVYRNATDDLPRLLADTSWSALPHQVGATELPPAIIFDVDETIVSNVDFQLNFERPFENWKLDEWTRGRPGDPIAGAKTFADLARAQGVELFFITNRPCEPRDGSDDPCPYRQSTLDDIRETGIDTDADHVLLSEERGWTREKSTRRDYIAETHRVIMLFGDDLTDFIPCTRSSAKEPCTNNATAESRHAAMQEHDSYWGNGWYMLPNPMHGSWTEAH